jgi:transketolase
LINDFKNANNVIIIEEHVTQGGMSSAIALRLLQEKISVNLFSSFNAKGYISGLYGNQQFHRDENHLNLESVFQCLNLL